MVLGSFIQFSLARSLPSAPDRPHDLKIHMLGIWIHLCGMWLTDGSWKVGPRTEWNSVIAEQFLIFLLIFRPHHVACWILVPQPGVEPVPPSVQSLNHWTTREILRGIFHGVTPQHSGRRCAHQLCMASRLSSQQQDQGPWNVFGLCSIWFCPWMWLCKNMWFCLPSIVEEFVCIHV